MAFSVLLVLAQMRQAFSMKAPYIAHSRCTVLTEAALMVASMLRKIGSLCGEACDACSSWPAAAPALVGETKVCRIKLA